MATSAFVLENNEGDLAKQLKTAFKITA